MTVNNRALHGTNSGAQGELQVRIAHAKHDSAPTRQLTLTTQLAGQVVRWDEDRTDDKCLSVLIS